MCRKIEFEKSISWIASNIGGFSTIKVVGLIFAPVEMGVKIVFGIVSAAIFAIVGELSRLWLTKQDFYKKYKDKQ
jgi:hypothetical protein